MSDRTSPRDALERLAWQLNFHHEETVSLNRLAEATDLSWATVRKYTQALETQQRIAPQLRLTDDGVEVGNRTDLVTELFDDPVEALAVYLLVNARRDGSATDPVDPDTHAPILERYPEALNELHRLGWVEETEDGLCLTPKGVRAAGPRASDITSGDRNIHSDSSSIQTFERSDETILVHTSDADPVRGTTNTANEWQQNRTFDRSGETGTDDDFDTGFGESTAVEIGATN